jgi:glucose-6-phosphate 1-dehydrogenase
MVSFRFSNSFMEPLWNRDHIESILIIMAEDFGIQGRGAFYDQTGAIRDVIQNHVFQVLCNLAMESPVNNDSEFVRDEKVKVLRAIPPIKPEDLIRGQFRGYLDENGVVPGSAREIYAVLRLQVKSWRWDGVPFFIRAGKNLPITCTEVLARLRPPPTTNITEPDNPQNYIRFRLNPEMTIAMTVSASSILGPGPRQALEMVATRHPRSSEIEPYERVLTDAMTGDPTLFARQDYVEQACRIVDPVLNAPTPVHTYEQHTWGPKEVEANPIPQGGWDVPQPEEQENVRVVQQAQR